MEKLTPETQKILRDGEHLRSLIKSDGWGIVRKKFSEKVLALGNILDIKDLENVQIEIGARQMAIEILINIIREIEADAVQYADNKAFFQALQDESYITIHD